MIVKHPACRSALTAILIVSLVISAVQAGAPAAGASARRAAPTRPSYELVDLGTLIADGLNAAGDVVGNSAGHPPHAILWRDGVMTDLGTLGGPSSQARAINGAGHVVGFSYVNDDHTTAVLWRDGVMTDLGSQVVGSVGSLFAGSVAHDVNDAGQVVGRAQVSDAGISHAMLWQSGTATDLDTLGSAHSTAEAINAAGAVVGSADQRAVLWRDGAMTVLAPLGGAYTVSEAVGINGAGAIVGTVYAVHSAPTAARAVIWQDGAVVDLGTLGGPYTNSSAAGINAGGEVVGVAYAPEFTDSRAVLWRDGAIIDLNDLIRPDTGWTLLGAGAINRGGDIVGWGIAPSGAEHSFLLRRPLKVIFLEGINTDLTPSEMARLGEPCSDPANDPEFFGRTKAALHAKGFACEDFLRFSYRGGLSDTAGRWTPRPYECADTHRRLSQSVFELKSMMGQYRFDNPNTRFILIGHSLGGVIAFEGATDLDHDFVTAVVTVDSPLNHVSYKNREAFHRRVADLTGALHVCAIRGLVSSPVSFDLGNVLASNRQAIRDQQAAKLAAARTRGTRFMAIGNAQDCVWYVALCGLSYPTPEVDWNDDTPTMVIAGADVQRLYPLGTAGCDLSGDPSILRFGCLPHPHRLPLETSGIISQIAEFVSG